MCFGLTGPISGERSHLQAPRGAYFEHLSNTSSFQVLDCSNTSSCQSNSHPYPGNPVLTLDCDPCLEPSDRHMHIPKQPFHFKYHLFPCRIRPSPAVSGCFRPYSYVFQSIGAVRCRGSRLNTAPLELKRIKLESGIRKYQLTIPLSKSIKEWSIPL